MPGNDLITVDGSSLAIGKVVQVARERTKVTLSKEAAENIRKSRSALERMAEQGKAIYGVTTGFGALSNTRITLDQAAELQTNLLRSHACGVGDNFHTDVVRAAMLLRLNTLAKGLSAVRLDVARLIESLLNNGIHPTIPSRGSVGASGDLAPLSHMALALLGEGNVEFHGEIVPASQALAECHLKPLTPTMKEGLALTNGTQISTAIAALVVHDAEALLKVAEIAVGMSLEALRGFVQPFDTRIHDARPIQGQMDVAHNIRSLVAGSSLVKEKVTGEHESVQDSYSLRCSPQILGAAREAIAFARRLVEIELNSATDNPLVFADSDDVLSGGNFHGQPIGLAMDVIAIGLATIAGFSERRIFTILDPDLNHGLPAFLAGGKEAGLRSGLMAIQYTAAALASENKVLAHPASVDSIPTCGDLEDYVSMSPTAGHKANAILSNAQRVTAIELICAAQALELRDPGKAGRGTRVAFERIRQKVSMVREDRPLAQDIETVRSMIVDGSIVQGVESSIGPLK